jgi:uncharacterized membrane protein
VTDRVVVRNREHLTLYVISDQKALSLIRGSYGRLFDAMRCDVDSSRAGNANVGAGIGSARGGSGTGSI